MAKHAHTHTLSQTGQECIRKVCMNSATFYHDALSLAVEYDDNNGVFKKTSHWNSEPTWTESKSVLTGDIPCTHVHARTHAHRHTDT